MSWSSFLWVFLGGGLGSLLRYLIGWWIPASGGFPWATFWANVISCVLIGLLLALAPVLSASTRLLLVTGFCGGLSTFSTFSRETFQLLERGEWLLALTYVTSSVVIGVALVFLAYWWWQR